MLKRILVNSVAALTIMIGISGLGFAKPASTQLMMSTCSGGGSTCSCAPGAKCQASSSGCSCGL